MFDNFRVSAVDCNSHHDEDDASNIHQGGQLAQYDDAHNGRSRRKQGHEESVR